MPIPTHNINCSTRAFQMGCPSCNAEVWFFNCSCGSKVFFDRLGYPWDQHECLEYRLEREINLIKNLHHLSEEEIYQAIIKHEKKSGEEINDRIWGIIEHTLGKRKSKLTIEKVEVTTPQTEVSGIVMEINNPINIFKRLGYDGNHDISRKLLGKIGNIEWAIARIRSNPDRKNHCLEFEVLIKQALIKQYPFRNGDLIIGLANQLSHLKGVVWELVKYEVYKLK